MPEAHFGTYEVRDLGDFCQHLIYSLKRSSGAKELRPAQALKSAASRAYDMRIKAVGTEFFRAALRLEYEFYSALQKKVTDVTTWDQLIGIVNECVSEKKIDLQETTPAE